MRVHVERAAIQPGDESWLEFPDELVFLVASEGVTRAGAEVLEKAWARFIDSGVWQFGPGKGVQIEARYFRTDHLPANWPAVVTSRGPLAKIYLSPVHFSAASTSGLRLAALDCVAQGWRYYAPEAARAAA